MNQSLKTFLLISLVVATFLAALIGAGVYWWHQNSGELMDATKTAITDGEKNGQHLDDEGCVNAALKLHTANGDPGIVSGVKNSMWLTGCFETSKPLEKFCEGVPAMDEYSVVGAWTSKSCVAHGLTDPYCPAIFQNVVAYCSSPVRPQKLKKLSAAEPKPDGGDGKNAGAAK